MATSTIQINLAKSAKVIQSNPDTNYHSDTSYGLRLNPPTEEAERVLLKFSSVPDSIKFKKLLSVRIYADLFRLVAGTNALTTFRPAPLEFSDFDETAVTWNTTYQPLEWVNVGQSSSIPGNAFTTTQYAFPPGYWAANDQPLAAKKAISGVVSIGVGSSGASASEYVYLDVSAPLYLELDYDPDTDVTSQIYTTEKISGYIDPHVDNVFTWDYENAGGNYCAGPFLQQSATFYWKESDASTYNSIAVGTSKQITIAADTFPVGSIDWYVSGTDENGTTTQTVAHRLSTTAALTTSVPYYPRNELVPQGPVTFTWGITNNNNQRQLGADLQYSSDDGANWETLGYANGNVRSLEIAANVMPGGSLLWRLRSYNADNVAGNWSFSNPFFYVSAPSVPVVAATEVPYSVITWSAANQQAYEVRIDGVSQGVKFGAEKEYVLSEPLFDSTHEISVRIQGQYGIWSDWGTTTITVENVPGDAVTLTGVFGIDAALSWTTDSATADFLLYRDGVRIGHTDGDSFTDRLAVGSHSYKVVNRLASGYYTASNIVTGAPAAQNLAVAAFDGGAWVNLPLTEKSDSEQNFAYTHDVSLRHYSGSAYPVLEVSPFKDRTGSYDCSFLTEAEAAPLMALLGRRVIVKSRGDNLLVGPLASITKVHGDFYVAYRFQVPACHYEDFVDDA